MSRHAVKWTGAGGMSKPKSRRGDRQTRKPEFRRLPDGNTTTSLRKYLKEWRGLGDVVAQELNGAVVAFDPGFLIRTENTTLDIPMSFARVVLRQAQDRTKIIDLEREVELLRVVEREARGWLRVARRGRGPRTDGSVFPSRKSLIDALAKLDALRKGAHS